MSTYTTQLESAKQAALAALTDLLTTTTDPIEKRRIATTILRIPTPQNPRGNAGATGATRHSASFPTEASSPTAPNPLAPSPNSPAQPATPEPSISIPTQPPLPNPLDFIRQSNALLSMLSARPKPSPRPPSPTSLLAAAGQAPSG